MKKVQTLSSLSLDILGEKVLQINFVELLNEWGSILTQDLDIVNREVREPRHDTLKVSMKVTCFLLI